MTFIPREKEKNCFIACSEDSIKNGLCDCHNRIMNIKMDSDFDIVKSHCISDDDDLIKEAIEEADSFGGFGNNNSELIAFVNGYIIGKNNK